MREIIFRGKCVPDSNYAGEWVIGGYAHPMVDNDKKEGLIVRYLGGNVTRIFHVLPSTVGQYTGLKDKEGKEIYEGDVVKRHCNAYGLDDIGVVKYDDEKAMFVLYCEKRHYAKTLPFLKQETINDGQCTIEETFTYEIIGNIHDNPELLKITK